MRCLYPHPSLPVSQPHQYSSSNTQSYMMGSLSESHVDLLVVGAGPAGLALANWFRNSSIRVLLVDKRPHATQRGQAEGLKSTTVEIFESIGIGPQVWAEAHRLEEIAIWAPDAATGELKREQVMQDKVEELGKPRECMLQQARCEALMAENLRGSDNITIRRSTRPTKLTIDEAKGEYPVTVDLISEDAEASSRDMNGTRPIPSSEVVHAKYIVGCDGARSWTRAQLGVKLEGDLTDSVFGVMDYIPKTNFPDIRKVCYLKASNGTILLVPRSNREVRMYIPVESGSELSDPKDITLDIILEAARKIIAPFSLDIGSCSWWSAYRVGQRVGDRFSTHNNRAFLAGDAVHTHSPKAGQGMNTSVQDATNLGWKLRLVLSSQASHSILSTYQSERLPVAQDLISFDRGYLKLFSSASSSFDDEFLKAAKFTTGLSIRYPASNIVQLPPGVSDLGPSVLKPDIVPGKRLADFQVICQADAVTTRIHPRLRATGAFRLLVFAGDIAQSALWTRLQNLGAWLADTSKGLGKLTSGGENALVEVLVIHCAERDQIELMDFHEIYRPWSDEAGYDYWRVYVDGMSVHEGHGKVYEKLEIDRVEGRLVVVRPDGYIGTVALMDEFEWVKRYFDGMTLVG